VLVRGERYPSRRHLSRLPEQAPEDRRSGAGRGGTPSQSASRFSSMLDLPELAGRVGVARPRPVHVASAIIEAIDWTTRPRQGHGRRGRDRAVSRCYVAYESPSG
jgi:hypothetical protein